MINTANLMDLPRYDLHCHSTASDGVLSPAEILQLAQDKNINVLALTDHDTIAGAQALCSAQQQGVKLILGAEFTCQWNSRILHILGLGINGESEELRNYLCRLELLRTQRAEKIAERLMKMGLPDLLEAAAKAADGGSIGRPHFARVMQEKGIVSTQQQAFKKYLGAGKKGDVKIEWPELSETVSTISQASGLSVLAHPTKYKMTFTKIREAVHAFKEVGGTGIEVSYPGVTPDQHMHLNRIAKTNQLFVSAGSDFHSPNHGWNDLGKFPALKETDNHILHKLLS